MSVTIGVTAPLTRLPTAVSSDIAGATAAVARPPAGFAFIRTVPGTLMRNPGGVYAVAPGVAA